jgi:hypothetical protein
MAVANFALPRRQTGLTKVAADAAVLRENGVREEFSPPLRKNGVREGFSETLIFE